MKSLIRIGLFLALISGLVAQTATQGIAWDDNSNNETGFTIEIAPAAPSTAFTVAGTVGANVTTFTILGLNLKTGYQVRVRAFNADTTSQYSNIVSFTTPVAPIATPVLRLTQSQVVILAPGEKKVFYNGSLAFNGANKLNASGLTPELP